MTYDGLDSNSKTASLSAKQGKILKQYIDAQAKVIQSLTEQVSELGTLIQNVNENLMKLDAKVNEYHVVSETSEPETSEPETSEPENSEPETENTETEV